MNDRENEMQHRNGPERDLAAAQEDKPAAASASPEMESPAVIAGEARPADPKDADDVLTHRLDAQASCSRQRDAADAEVLAASRRRTRRAFVGFAAAAAGAYGVRRYLMDGPTTDMVPSILHRGYAWNADVSRTVFREHALAPTYPVAKAETARVNGVFGLKRVLKPESYRLQLVGVRDSGSAAHHVSDVTAWQYEYSDSHSSEDQGHDTKTDPSKASSAKMAPDGMQRKTAEDEESVGRRPRGQEEAGESRSTLAPGTPGLLLPLDEALEGLPRQEMVLQFKCIEGWSQIVQWSGVRFRDFLEKYPPAPTDGADPKYAYMETPDGDYYVGYDLHVLRHPQTLLVTGMMGAPLTQFHGAPLRLYTPTKYGYKQIKRVGLIAYTNTKPDDYWTKLGYDWYAGL